MTTTILAHFDGEYFVPDQPVTELSPGDRVEVVRIIEPSAPNSKDDPLLRLIDFAVDTGIPDLAENADHYLYGHPKQSEEVDDR